MKRKENTMLDPGLALLVQCIVEGDNYYRNENLPSIENIILQCHQLGEKKSDFQNEFKALEKYCQQDPETVLDYVEFLAKEHAND